MDQCGIYNLHQRHEAEYISCLVGKHDMQMALITVWKLTQDDFHSYSQCKLEHDAKVHKHNDFKIESTKAFAVCLHND